MFHILFFIRPFNSRTIGLPGFGCGKLETIDRFLNWTDLIGSLMCYAITDRKLEDLSGFEPVEGRVDAKCTIVHGCVRLERADDDFFKRYTHGFGDFQELLNRVLHTEGVRWYVYGFFTI